MTRKIEAVIFDWAGTMVDHGSLAPVRALTRLFEGRGVPITDEQARRDMGILKRDHIERVLAIPEVAEAWTHRYGHPPGLADLDSLYEEFQPMQMECLADYSTLIPGAGVAVRNLQARGIKVASNTGYTRPMLDLLLEKAAQQGYVPDLSVSPDEVGGGRPHPWMFYRIGLEFRLSASAFAVKIGDTSSDIAEGLNAGTWTIGIARTGNEIGLSEADFHALPEDEQRRRVARARANLLAAGAHYVTDSVAECALPLEQIERRIQAGERP